MRRWVCSNRRFEAAPPRKFKITDLEIRSSAAVQRVEANPPLNPGKLSTDELTQAWRRATDSDVRGALQDSEGLDAQAIAIIQAEAGIRGIETEQDTLIRTFNLGRKVRSLLNDHLKARSPLISFIAGAAYVAVPRIVAHYLTGISSGLWYVFWLGVSIVANAILCWPLRSYRKAFINTLVFILPNVLWF